jgi:hypothetical protein
VTPPPPLPAGPESGSSSIPLNSVASGSGTKKQKGNKPPKDKPIYYTIDGLKSKPKGQVCWEGKATVDVVRDLFATDALGPYPDDGNKTQNTQNQKKDIWSLTMAYMGGEPPYLPFV